MNNYSCGPHPRRAATHAVIMLILACMLTGCTLGTNNNTTAAPQHTVPAATPTINITPTAPPSIQLGQQTCPKAIDTAAYWNPKVPTQPSSDQVESIICAYLMGKTQLQALVSVRHKNSGLVLDLHVYDKINDPAPKEVFQVSGLYKGEAKVSTYNTVLTSEVNQNSPQNQKLSGNTMVNDLQREFKWADSRQTLVPVSFPGLFPSTTRYQAEAEQQQVNQGQEAWKLSATRMATTFVASSQFFNWHNGTQATIVSGGGQKDVDAVVKVEHNSAAGKNTATITMTRLENNANGGIWIVTKASSEGLSLDTPAPQSLLKSPVAVSGKGPAFEGVIGKISVLDSHYNTLGTTDAHGQQGNGPTSFTATVTYTPTFKTGTEDGMLVLISNSNADGSVNGIAIVKQLLG
ncbi:hypothetical protein KDW_12860 [Dictyobacter vulcani]|uniref:Bacterial spore germination immunoglobulin-like domain-containing protein n=1 Tax=Dictyobacter vulcani TaxID=2607529 RepID=A0A5J4KDJ0_9CHLR|nr:Gmad2 immunoglobulin-like domain-containing protein [Dictyobacter vulcani]GER87124.1 hypothetical protein KDW_12860 [Dictyobacter vulcani]